MNTAIIGCGSIAQVHASCIKTMAEHTLISVSDCIPEKAEDFGSKFHAKPYTDWKYMLETENIQILHICTPHYLHTPMAIFALDHGIHVFMEKPPVISWEQWEDLKEAAIRNKEKATLGFCFQNRFNPSICNIKKRLDQGEFGKLLGVRGLVTWCREEAYYLESTWRGTLEQEGGGVLINQSIHTMDLMQYFIGKPPLSIDASISNFHLKDKIEVEDTMTAYITYEDIKACFYATTSYVSDVPPLIELECEKARVRIENLAVTLFYYNNKEENEEFSAPQNFGKSYWGSGHQDCIQSFYDSIKSNQPFSLTIEEINHTVWLMLSAYESARAKTERS